MVSKDIVSGVFDYISYKITHKDEGKRLPRS
jgi:hypothetical protein